MMIFGLGLLLIFIGGRDDSTYGEGVYYALKAIVVPKFGFYCMIVAQRMSRVSSQFLLDYHDRVTMKATEIYDRKEGDTSISHVIEDRESQEGTRCNGIEPPTISVIDYRDLYQNSIENSFSNEQEEVELHNHSLSEIPTWTLYTWGHLSAILGGITIAIVFVIGCVLAPAIAFDVSSIGGISIESENTFDEAVSEYGVFVVISGILLHARFVIKTNADYIGLGLLLFAAALSVSMTFILKSYRFLRRKIKERRERRNNSNKEKHTFGHEGCGLPSYFRLYKWKHMEIYFISVCIGVWQLGSVVSYSIHLYCSILTGLYDLLTSMGIVEPTEAKCNRIQALQPSSLLITLGSLVILLVAFYLQVSSQYKKNLEQATKYVDDKDIPRLSLAWSEDKTKNTRYSHLTETLSFSTDTLSSRAERSLRTRAGSNSYTRTDSSISPYANRSYSDSPGSVFFRTISTPSNAVSEIQPSSSEDTIEEVPDIEQSTSTRTPIATEVSSERGSAIDAACEVVAPNRLLTRNSSPSEFTNNVMSSKDDDESDEESTTASMPPPLPDGLRRHSVDDSSPGAIAVFPSYSDRETERRTSIISGEPTFRSTEDTASVTSPESPRRRPMFFSSNQPTQPLRSSSRSPPPRFQSTSDYLHHIDRNTNESDRHLS